MGEAVHGHDVSTARLQNIGGRITSNRDRFTKKIIMKGCKPQVSRIQALHINRALHAYKIALQYQSNIEMNDK